MADLKTSHNPLFKEDIKVVLSNYFSPIVILQERLMQFLLNKIWDAHITVSFILLAVTPILQLPIYWVF